MVLKDVCAVVGGRVAPFELGVLHEVFGVDRSEQGLPTYDFAVVAVDDGPLTAGGGLSFHTPHRLDRLATADLIGETLRSLQAQSFGDFEVVVVDDAGVSFGGADTFDPFGSSRLRPLIE